MMKDIKGKKVLIIKLRYIGDTLSIIPVVENIKEKAPDITVDVMVNRGTEELVTHHPDIRKLWIYERRTAKKSFITSISYHKKFIKQLINIFSRICKCVIRFNTTHFRIKNTGRWTTFRP